MLSHRRRGTVTPTHRLACLGGPFPALLGATHAEEPVEKRGLVFLGAQRNGLPAAVQGNCLPPNRISFLIVRWDRFTSYTMIQSRKPGISPITRFTARLARSASARTPLDDRRPIALGEIRRPVTIADVQPADTATDRHDPNLGRGSRIAGA